MDRINQLFLEALGASVKDETVGWEAGVSAQEWETLWQLAQTHNVLPMVFEATYAAPAARSADPQMIAQYRRRTVQSVMLQTMKTSEFLALLQHLEAAGMTPSVVKGIVCRSLYPKPDYRMSGDEDVLIPEEQFERCHQAMCAFGMQPVKPDVDLKAEYEIAYGKPGSALYIELHKKLFPPESDAYGELNGFFEGAHERTTHVEIDGASVRTLDVTDHFLYLIFHSFKHFLHSGFGIRQVCDIVLFANRYGQEIDWGYVLNSCRAAHAELFAAALLKIGERYLTFDPDKAGYPGEWRALDVDEEDMLNDLLDAGVFGDASMSRKHSSMITLDAVSAQKKGKKGRGSLLKTILPPVKDMIPRYPVLKKKPWLLPVTWADRLIRYGRETARSENNDAAQSIRIGSERVQLLKKYGVIR